MAKNLPYKKERQFGESAIENDCLLTDCLLVEYFVFMVCFGSLFFFIIVVASKKHKRGPVILFLIHELFR